MTGYPLLIEVGEKYGRLTVQQVIPGGRGWWGTRVRKVRCLCDCGKVTEVRPSGLVSGNTRSCGCYNVERIVATFTTHGKSHSLAYYHWIKLIQPSRHRSSVPIALDYTCAEWVRDFGLFYSDMGDPPSDQYVLSLIDSKGIYCKDNCRWIDKNTETHINRRTRPITVGGVTKSMSEWDRHNNWKCKTVFGRLKLGWSEHDAVTAPLGTKNPNTQKVNP